MVHIAADLPQFLQRRELAAYEQRLARTGYAYGVDLRRAAWLAGSMLGDPLMPSLIGLALTAAWIARLATAKRSPYRGAIS